MALRMHKFGKSRIPVYSVLAFLHQVCYDNTNLHTGCRIIYKGGCGIRICRKEEKDASDIRTVRE